MTAIERHRWHADLTPQFELTCRVTSSERAELRVALLGPAGLDRLDRATVHIRDDIPGRAPAMPGEPTAEEIARQIWGRTGSCLGWTAPTRPAAVSHRLRCCRAAGGRWP
jgi:hypothetical protein